MSIIASVKVYDGLVLAADSMTNIFGQDASGMRAYVQTFQYSNKLFQVSHLPAGICTYGIGNIGPRSIESLINEFCVKNYDAKKASLKGIEEITKELLAFISGFYIPAYEIEKDKPQLGFLIGGYSPNSPFPEEWEFRFPDLLDVKQVRPLEQYGASWRGTAVPFSRLYRGIDPRAIDHLKDQGITEELLSKVSKDYEIKIVFDGMPVQDAIDLAKFIINTTIGIARFEAGFPSCGGPIDIAVIHPNKKFQWIQKKNYETIK